MDTFSENRQHRPMLQRVEARLYVGFYEPRCSDPLVIDLRESGVASPIGTKTMGVTVELRLVKGFQQEPDHLLKQLVRKGRHSQGAQLLRAFLLDIGAPDWRPSIAFVSEILNDRFDLGHRHSIHRFRRRSRGHCALVPIDLAIRVEIQLRVTQLSIQIGQRQSSFAAFVDDTQDCFGSLHFAYLPFAEYRKHLLSFAM